MAGLVSQIHLCVDFIRGPMVVLVLPACHPDCLRQFVNGPSDGLSVQVLIRHWGLSVSKFLCLLISFCVVLLYTIWLLCVFSLQLQYHMQHHISDSIIVSQYL